MDFKSIYEHVSKIDGTSFDDESQVIVVSPSSLMPLMEKIKEDEKLDFNYLMCITALDSGNSKDFIIAYNLHSYQHNHDIEVRVNVNIDEDIQVPSLVSLWKTADWHEREAFDLMGIRFDGHPDLRRILLPDDWEGHPLQKNYEICDYYHGVPVPKDKTYWE